eukprot:s588_g16.t1
MFIGAFGTPNMPSVFVERNGVRKMQDRKFRVDALMGLNLQPRHTSSNVKCTETGHLAGNRGLTPGGNDEATLMLLAVSGG